MTTRRVSERLHMAVSSDFVALLDVLTDITNSPSRTETVRRAVAIYNQLVEACLEENTIVVRDSSANTETQIVIPITPAS